MISIIISSYQPILFDQLSKNIHQTIGVDTEFEIIRIHNPGLMGICKAYNIGAEKAKYENLLFIHEDILFMDQNWGAKLVQILTLPNCGVIGVAGGDYYSYVPGSWWNNGHKFLHLIQTDGNDNETFNDRCYFPEGSKEVPAKGIDGVFLACSKSTYDDIKFDENITGYHGYDLVFSLKSAKKHTNYVTSQILINHFSAGSLSKEWFQNILKVKEIIGNFPDQITDRKIETDNFYKLIFYLKKFGFKRNESFKIVCKYLNFRILGFRNALKIINRTKHLW